MTPAQKARAARLRYAYRAEQHDAWWATYIAEQASHNREPLYSFVMPSGEYGEAGWPISGDDLALAKAGKIA